MIFRLPHLVAALLLHVVLIGLLVAGAHFQSKPRPPPVISAVLLDPSRQETARRKRQEEQSRLEEQRKAEEEMRRRQQAETALRKKKEDEARRQKQLAEQKAADRKKAEETTRRKREAEERSRIAQAIREEETRRALEREQAERAASERDEKLVEWAEALIAHVAENFKIPPGAPPDFVCQVRMQLLPDGTVTDAKIVKSCGSALLDQSVEDAVYRSSPLPRPSDPAVFDRDLTINFKPKPQP